MISFNGATNAGVAELADALVSGDVTSVTSLLHSV